MDKTFEDALNDLLAEYSRTPRDELISAMELGIMALKEQPEEDGA